MRDQETAEEKYLINFTQPRKRFVLSLHCNVTTKDSKIKDYTLCLGNNSKGWY